MIYQNPKRVVERYLRNANAAEEGRSKERLEVVRGMVEKSLCDIRRKEEAVLYERIENEYLVEYLKRESRKEMKDKGRVRVKKAVVNGSSMRALPCIPENRAVIENNSKVESKSIEKHFNYDKDLIKSSEFTEENTHSKKIVEKLVKPRKIRAISDKRFENDLEFNKGFTSSTNSRNREYGSFSGKTPNPISYDSAAEASKDSIKIRTESLPSIKKHTDPKHPSSKERFRSFSIETLVKASKKSTASIAAVENTRIVPRIKSQAMKDYYSFNVKPNFTPSSSEKKSVKILLRSFSTERKKTFKDFSIVKLF